MGEKERAGEGRETEREKETRMQEMKTRDSKVLSVCRWGQRERMRERETERARARERERPESKR